MKVIQFSKNLKALRMQKNMTQAQLATLLCVDQRTISAWENDICEPSFLMLLQLCDIFDESLDSLITK